ncbi:MAG: MBL fold metallo-hydrolase [Lachnospiraceae bacterium]|nr:MBL fold metallo-hydrolase [Lachnospiraceae bacterium]
MIMSSCLVLFIHPCKDLEIRNVDVGQGDCALITGDDIPAVLIDGGSSDIKEVADNRIIPVLRSNRVPVIDWCFLTHMDSDHVNGVIGLLENDTSGIYIERLVVSAASLSDAADGENVSRLLAAAKKRGTDVITMSAGDVLRLNGARIICLSPAKESILRRTSGSSNTDENDNSLVLRLEYKGFSALFTGDIGEEVEKTIADSIGDCDYLKVAHHGSRNSTSGDFLKRADPELSVISAGVNNSYGHPHKETVERLKGTGTRIYITADDGEVIMTVDEGIVRVVTMVGNGSK